MYSEVGLFWQYLTYICNLFSLRWNTDPISSGCSRHRSIFFMKKLRTKWVNESYNWFFTLSHIISTVKFLKCFWWEPVSLSENTVRQFQLIVFLCAKTMQYPKTLGFLLYFRLHKLHLLAPPVTAKHWKTLVYNFWEESCKNVTSISPLVWAPTKPLCWTVELAHCIKE